MKTLDNGIERDMTADELANHKKLCDESDTQIAVATARVAARASALAKLAALGLTADEIAAL